MIWSITPEESISFQKEYADLCWHEISVPLRQGHLLVTPGEQDLMTSFENLGVYPQTLSLFL